MADAEPPSVLVVPIAVLGRPCYRRPREEIQPAPRIKVGRSEYEVEGAGTKMRHRWRHQPAPVIPPLLPPTKEQRSEVAFHCDHAHWTGDKFKPACGRLKVDGCDSRWNIRWTKEPPIAYFENNPNTQNPAAAETIDAELIRLRRAGHVGVWSHQLGWTPKVISPLTFEKGLAQRPDDPYAVGGDLGPSAKDKDRLCCNLRYLNQFMEDEEQSEMPTIAEFAALVVEPGALWMKLDHVAGYQHLATNEEDWPFLCFCWRGTTYFWKAAPFGGKTIPAQYQRITSTALRIAIPLAREAFYERFQPKDDYLLDGRVFIDDNGLVAQCRALAPEVGRRQQLLEAAEHELLKMGFLFSVKKRMVARVMPLIGYVLDSSSLLTRMNAEKEARVQRIANRLKDTQWISLRALTRGIGRITSQDQALRHAMLYCRMAIIDITQQVCVRWEGTQAGRERLRLMEMQVSGSRGASYARFWEELDYDDFTVELSQEARVAFSDLSLRVGRLNGRGFPAAQTGNIMVLEHDAGPKGVGGVAYKQGKRKHEELWSWGEPLPEHLTAEGGCLSTTRRETYGLLRAVHHCDFTGVDEVIIIGDNIGQVLGVFSGTKDRQTTLMMLQVINYLEDRGVRVREARAISGHDNDDADYMSRLCSESHFYVTREDRWKLAPDCEIDLMADRTNRTCDRFVSRFREDGCEGIDLFNYAPSATSSEWTVAWLFPPRRLAEKVVATLSSWRSGGLAKRIYLVLPGIRRLRWASRLHNAGLKVESSFDVTKYVNFPAGFQDKTGKLQHHLFCVTL